MRFSMHDYPEVSMSSHSNFSFDINLGAVAEPQVQSEYFNPQMQREYVNPAQQRMDNIASALPRLTKLVRLLNFCARILSTIRLKHCRLPRTCNGCRNTGRFPNRSLVEPTAGGDPIIKLVRSSGYLMFTTAG